MTNKKTSEPLPESTSKPGVSVTSCGDDSILIDFGNVLDANTCVRVLWARLMQNPPDFCLEPVAGVSTLLVVIKPQYREWKYLSQYCKVMEQWGQQALGQAPASGREITLPICYETLMAPDLDRVAEFCGLSQKEIIQHHQSGVYLAELIGFMPGFAYLSGVDPTLNVPRLPTPRQAVPAGSLGITGNQCAIYPSATPGGWNLIGRCPLRLFDPKREDPCVIQLGDQVRFEAITLEEFEQLWAQR